MNILFIILGIIVGAIVGALFVKSQTGGMATKLEMQATALEQAKQENELAKRESEQLKTKMEHLNAEKQEALTQYHTLRAQLQAAEKQGQALEIHHAQTIAHLKQEHERQREETRVQHQQALAERDRSARTALDAQERRHTEAVQAMRTQFEETMAKVEAQVKNATADMLKERQREFAQSSQQDLGQLVNPLRETIDRMQKVMADSTNKQTELSSELRVNIEHVLRQSQAAKESADELTRVFKHQSKVQGDWGETVLDELLQAQGLTPGIHYDTQAVIRDAAGNVIHTDAGKTMRPDVILHLDQRREVIIDSKVSLTAFIDYVNAETDSDRQQHLDAHLRSLQSHVDELARKDYSAYIQSPKVKMDYVIMFVPHANALWTALNAQPALWRRAMERNVFIADEQSLFAALRIIHLTWTQIRQAQSHEQVFKLANEMLDRVGTFWAEYEAMGKALEKAQQAYANGRNKIAHRGQSIAKTATKLLDLGAKLNSKKPLPDLLDVDDIPALSATDDEPSQPA